MNDHRICPICRETIVPARRLGPHISSHRRTDNAKYVYLNGDTKHPYERKACLTCKEESYIQKRNSFCSYKCCQSGMYNSNYAPDSQKTSTAYGRSNSWFKVPNACEWCGQSEKRIVRHHRDHNIHHNTRDNIAFICDKCHSRHHILKPRPRCLVCKAECPRPSSKFCGRSHMSLYFSKSYSPED